MAEFMIPDLNQVDHTHTIALSDDMLAAIRHRIGYDPINGSIFWINPTATKCKPGDPVGSVAKGYISVHLSVDGIKRKIAGHQIAWFLHYGVWPTTIIDHWNGVGTDLRIKNLRVADPGGNSQNQKIRSDNTTGVQGVTWNSKECMFSVQISHKNIRHHIGFFNDLEIAQKARLDAEGLYHGDFAASNRSGLDIVPHKTIESRTGVRGVSWDRFRGKYTAEIQIDKKRIRLGRFDTLEEARVARLAAESDGVSVTYELETDYATI